ncbi:MAG TPA: thiamine pyrophosphate-binding protein [Solirubrobacteraceae bacterium]|nr:thiamine pyrophosphate-binding protein [Solirubrobacteraceae bacterium]
MIGAATSVPDPALRTTAQRIARMLQELGIREAYGVCGREIAHMWSALLQTRGSEDAIATMHARHENGAGFCAIGSWTQTGRPAAVFVTTAPGLANVITSLEVARATSAQLVLLSPLTPASERGRLGIQATGPGGFLPADLYTEGRIFDVVSMLESPAQLPALAGRLASGFAGDGAFMAHIAIPTDLQGEPTAVVPAIPARRRAVPAPPPELADEIVELMVAEPFAVWVGWGARRHAAAIRELLDRTGAPAVSSPRGLGIVDAHRQFVGVTGNGGHPSVPAELARWAPQRTLVLGTRLAEATSGWLPELVPPKGLIHIDIDVGVFARAYPQVPTLEVPADIGAVLAAILARSERLVHRPPPAPAPPPARLTLVPSSPRPIHPAAVMAAIQRQVVDATDMPVLADASSSMFWATRQLHFREPGRWFVEGHVGCMGAMGAAVVGSAVGRGGSALAIVGDGAMHMQDEINTAVRYGTRAIWVVLNDSGLGIVRTGMQAAGLGAHDADYPPTDFAAVARAKGARALRVTRERDLDRALRTAVHATGPILLDVVVDPAAPAPIGARARR